MTWAILVTSAASLAASSVSLVLLLRLLRSIRSEIAAGRQALELKELAEQVAGLRRVVDRLNDTIHEELLHEQEHLGTITENN